MTIYNVYVKPVRDNLVHDKRFEVDNLNELADKVNSFFAFPFELVRVEKVEVVEDYIPIKFGTNYNTIHPSFEPALF